MGWIYRQVDQHQCPMPKADRNTRAGDLWQCGENGTRRHGGCGKLWRVRDDQKDGPLLVEVPDSEREGVLQWVARASNRA